jgi:pimeloyl-ACP methyl ester carboxylesterase
MGSEIARPLTFQGCAGWLHPAAGPVGVVLCSPWGFEELCLRRAWRMLADELAAKGFPTLRFDYPGAADSLDPPDGPTLEDLAASVVQAVDALKTAAGVARVVLVGQGLGGAIAALAAPAVTAEGLALLAPAVRGRDHLRELSIWGAMTAEAMHLAPGVGGVAGFELPAPLASGLAAFDLCKLEAAPAGKVLVAARPGRAGEARLADRMVDLGASVERLAYEGYEAALGNPTSARPPVAVIEAVAAWAAANFPGEPGEVRRPADAAPLEGEGFVETRVRFGSGDRLAGVLCEPKGVRRGATVLMLSAGGDPHTGWARSAVDHARALARDGVASLRMDAADVGDSAGPLSGEPPRLYDAGHGEDASRAIGWLEAYGFGPVLPVGRCSGAFIAFSAAVQDPRIAEVVLVNPQRFVWDRDGRMELAEDQVGHYQRAARDPKALAGRLLRGEVDLAAVAAKLGRAALAVVQGKLAGHERRRLREIRAAFRRLRDRGVRTTLLFSEGGESHQAFAAMFGADGKGLAGCSNAELIRLEDADHGLTPAPARAALLDLLRDRALAPPASVAAEHPAAGTEDLPAGAGVLGGAVAAA